MELKCIINGTLITPHDCVDDELWIENGIIKQIGTISKASDYKVIDAKNCYVTPGLIDIHVHGGAGCNFLDNDLNTIEKLKLNLIKHGITSIYPTIMSAPLQHMIDSISFLSQIMAKQDPELPELLGINLEGPFLSPEYTGIHAKEDLCKPDNEILRKLITDLVKIITIAPELDPSGEIISYLAQKDIVVSMGHSAASYEQAVSAHQKGIKLVTHIFNAMKPLHHRAPGLITAALNLKELYIELIADGVHVYPEVIKLVLKAKDPDKIILISDSIALRECPDMDYYAGNDKIILKENKAVNAKGVISGSVLPLDQSVRNLVEWNITDFKTAINFATYNPAKLVSLSNKRGCLLPEAKANIVLWDKTTLNIKSVIINGKHYLV